MLTNMTLWQYLVDLGEFGFYEEAYDERFLKIIREIKKAMGF